MNTERKPTLLVVDDEATNIEIIADIFGDDYEVLFASEGKKALEIANQENPDLILLDVMMPGMDGYEVCRRLKAIPDTAQIPVIFITALGEIGAEIIGLSIGAVDYVTKPFCPEIVKIRVQNQLELKFARERLSRLATIDGLTGLANRRYFDEILEHKWNRSLRTGRALGVGILDMDLFRHYNDHYGHQLGDDCLRTVALALKEQVRLHKGDLEARYGGDEFVFISLADSLGAIQMAQSICVAMQNLGIPHALSPQGKVTVSIGVASFVPNETLTLYNLIQDAENALRTAKKQGRNQAVLAI